MEFTNFVDALRIFLTMLPVHHVLVLNIHILQHTSNVSENVAELVRWGS